MHAANNVKRTLIALALAFSASAACAEVVVIVSTKNPITALSAEQASDLFLGNASTFAGGSQAVPIDQVEGSPARDEFYAKAASKSPSQLKAYWSKVIFTGKGRPPKEVPDSAAVKKLVADNPNIIAYIDKSAVESSVKVVLTVH